MPTRNEPERVKRDAKMTFELYINELANAPVGGTYFVAYERGDKVQGQTKAIQITKDNCKSVQFAHRTTFHSTIQKQSSESYKAKPLTVRLVDEADGSILSEVMCNLAASVHQETFKLKKWKTRSDDSDMTLTFAVEGKLDEAVRREDERRKAEEKARKAEEERIRKEKQQKQEEEAKRQRLENLRKRKEAASHFVLEEIPGDDDEDDDDEANFAANGETAESMTFKEMEGYQHHYHEQRDDDGDSNDGHLEAAVAVSAKAQYSDGAAATEAASPSSGDNLTTVQTLVQTQESDFPRTGNGHQQASVTFSPAAASHQQSRYLEEIGNLEGTLRSLTQSLEHNKKERTALMSSIAALNAKVCEKDEQIRTLQAVATHRSSTSGDATTTTTREKPRSSTNNRRDGESRHNNIGGDNNNNNADGAETASTVTTISSGGGSAAAEHGERRRHHHHSSSNNAARDGILRDAARDDEGPNSPNPASPNGRVNSRSHTKEGWHFTYKTSGDGSTRDGEHDHYVLRLQASNKVLVSEVEGLRKELRHATTQHEHHTRVADSKLNAARKEAHAATTRADETAAKLAIVKQKYTEAATYIQSLEGRLKLSSAAQRT